MFIFFLQIRYLRLVVSLSFAEQMLESFNSAAITLM